MNALDYVFLAILAIFAIRCLARGLVAEVLSTLAIVGGALAGVLLYRQAGALVASLTGLSTLVDLAGFAAAFVVVFLLVKIVELALRRTLEAVHLGWVDRALGFGLGLVEGLLIVSAALILLRVQPLVDARALLDGSAVARFILPILADGGAVPR